MRYPPSTHPGIRSLHAHMTTMEQSDEMDLAGETRMQRAVRDPVQVRCLQAQLIHNSVMAVVHGKFAAIELHHAPIARAAS